MRELRTHARKLVTLNSLSSLQQIPKLGNTLYFLPRGLELLTYHFKKLICPNHMVQTVPYLRLVDDVVLRSFCAAIQKCNPLIQKPSPVDSTNENTSGLHLPKYVVQSRFGLCSSNLSYSYVAGGSFLGLPKYLVAYLGLFCETTSPLRPILAVKFSCIVYKSFRELS